MSAEPTISNPTKVCPMSELTITSPTITALYPTTTAQVGVKVKEAMDFLEPLSKTLSKFGRGHTDAQWNTFVVGSEYGLARQFSQVCAELKSKRDALVSSIYGYKKTNLEAKIKEDKAEQDGLLPSERELLMVEAQEIRSNAHRTNDIIIGATKDISKLECTYKLLEEKIIEKYGSFSEKVLEDEERRYWVIRGFSQSMRDIRQSGTITKGEQKLLDDIGIDPMEATAQIKSYLKFCEDRLVEGNGVPSGSMRDFMEKMADTYERRVNTTIENFGTTERHLED
jgi:hypothetical protein